MSCRERRGWPQSRGVHRNHYENPDGLVTVRALAFLVLTLLLAGCGSKEPSPAVDLPPAQAPLANLTVRVCPERCGDALVGAEIWVNDEGPPRGLTGADGNFVTQVPVPGEYRLEAFPPKGYTMEGGPAVVIAGNTTQVSTEIIVYRTSIRGPSSATWTPPMLGSTPNPTELPFILHEDLGIQIAYQDRLTALQARITWPNDAGEDVRLLPCAGTDKQPALMVGQRENESVIGERSAILNPTPQTMQPLLDALALGEVLQMCVTSESGGFALASKDVSADLAFSFTGKSTRRISS